MKVVSVALGLLGCGMITSLAFEKPDIGYIAFMSVVGLGCIVGAAYSLSTHYIVDNEGLSFVRFWKKKTILWIDLDHYEIQTVSTPASNDTYLFRASDGTTIGMQDFGQDAKGLLACVQKHKHLKEKPYRRKHMLGG